MMNCDPVAGACLLPAADSPAERATAADPAGLAVRYVGDPMCSWCWGISPAVAELASFCEAEGIGFSMTVGGLRAGGGDAWNAAFKDFLRGEWRHIAAATGQPFGFTLLDKPDFNYDTEPACRAVVTVQLLQARQSLPASAALTFFAAVQRKFYVEGEDPKLAGFYAGICADMGVDFAEFRELFESLQARQATQQAFAQVRQWGVRSFPTVLLEREGKVAPLAVGFVTAEQLRSRLRQHLAA